MILCDRPHDHVANPSIFHREAVQGRCLSPDERGGARDLGNPLRLIVTYCPGCSTVYPATGQALKRPEMSCFSRFYDKKPINAIAITNNSGTSPVNTGDQ